MHSNAFLGLSLALGLALAPAGAAALCDGPSFLDQMTPEEQTALEAAVAATPFADGLLWQATRDDHQITLLGTLHIDAPSLPALQAVAAPYVTTADLLLVEATKAEETALIKALTDDPAIFMITDGPTLPDRLPTEMWDKISEAAKARGIPPFMVSQYQPWYLGLTLAIPPCAMAAISSSAPGLDHRIIADAQAADVPVAALEPWDTLIDVLRDGSIDEQIAQLPVALPPVALQESIFAAMLDGFANARTAEMWETSRLAVARIPDVDPAEAQAIFAQTEQGLLIDRNLAWMPMILDAARDNSRLMVAAGAAHLPGDQGLLNLLRDDGWTLTRLD
ncbi:TraB/GumN family protein [Yoonia sp. 208BN28-4]|uniref:TraB/GumN family protein n=1 Tax=Yoonia sp. 208BN28-4 TaxID=3126505 RepID=UPI0030ACB17B